MIIDIYRKEEDAEGYNFLKIDVDGKQNLYVFDGEREDNCLTRNFSGVFLIKDLLEKVIIAARKDEPITINQIFV